MDSPVLSKGDLKGVWQTRPRRATPVLLLLLSFLCVCACLEEDCVLATVGRPVSLPCFHNELSALKNVSIEWRREDEVVLASTWEEDRNVEEWSVNGATLASDALLTGNLSLMLLTVDPIENEVDYSLVTVAGGNQTSLLCSVCLRSTASFSSPLVHEEAHGEQTTYICSSAGGFPEPTVYWVINGAEEPPEGSVTTQAASDPDSHLYNVTSHLTLSNASVSNVTCVVENRFMNKSLTSTSRVQPNSEAKDPSEPLWIFSLALCVAVGTMVIAAVVYQIHLDRKSKRLKKEYENSNRGHKRQFPNEGEAEVLKIETDV
ncbi:ICOS ligand-like isoform X2 [Betta splendens]|uniref:ICOS ligand-like isoform X2 n=1 Tax=Betta splendens TaxID=158456 RepID=A0A9W2XQV3_BETSP|nr:ICOS ligand-like isoform X2 [Betta splendens]